MLKETIALGLFCEQQKMSTGAKLGTAGSLGLGGYAAYTAKKAKDKADSNLKDINFLNRMRKGGRANMFDRLGTIDDY